jgi:hypothetical protein
MIAASDWCWGTTIRIRSIFFNTLILGGEIYENNKGNFCFGHNFGYVLLLRTLGSGT